MVVGLISVEILCSAGMKFNYVTLRITILSIMIFVIHLNGSPFDVQWTCSLTVRMDHSISRTCLCFATVLMLQSNKLLRVHSNLFSTKTSVTWKLCAWYIYIVHYRPCLLLTSPIVRNMRSRAMVWRNGVPGTKRKSEVISMWRSCMVMGRGMIMAAVTYCGACWVVFIV